MSYMGMKTHTSGSNTNVKFSIHGGCGPNIFRMSSTSEPIGNQLPSQPVLTLFLGLSLFIPDHSSLNRQPGGAVPSRPSLANRSQYTAHKKFMNGFACRGLGPYGAIISTGRCQKTLVCKSAK